MDFLGILGLVLIGTVVYFLIFRMPPADLVYSSHSESEIMKVQRYLEANGIKTYTKNRIARGIRYGGGRSWTEAGALSLHVIEAGDHPRAVVLIRQIDHL